jgi:hypothetical protein
MQYVSQERRDCLPEKWVGRNESLPNLERVFPHRLELSSTGNSYQSCPSSPSLSSCNSASVKMFRCVISRVNGEVTRDTRNFGRRFFGTGGQSSATPFTKTTVEMATPPPIGGLARAKNFFYKNRQGIINTLGVYFVFAYAVHNYRVQVAWDEREVQFHALESELERVRTSLCAEAWAADVERTVHEERSKRTRTQADGAILTDAILKVLHWVPLTAEQRVTQAALKSNTNNTKDKSYVSSAAAFIANTAAVGGIGGNGVAATGTDTKSADGKEGGVKMV